MTRRPITSQTVAATAAENAGHPLSKDRAEAQLEAVEAMLQQVEVLRRLPLKDVEPAPLFKPIETKPR